MFGASPWLSYLIGYVIAALASLLIVGPTIRCLWWVALADLKKKKIDIPLGNVHAASFLRMLHGVIEVWLYTSCIVFGKPEGIAVWLGFKAVQRWKSNEETDPRHISGSLIYLIGTAMSIGVGVVGGLVATRQWVL